MEIWLFFEAKIQPREQLINLTTDIVLMAAGAVSSGLWALVTVKGAHRSEKSGKTQICQNTWKDLTQRPHSCCTICMSASGQILFSCAIHRPAVAGLIGEVATQVWYWTGVLTTWMNNTVLSNAVITSVILHHHHSIISCTLNSIAELNKKISAPNPKSGIHVIWNKFKNRKREGNKQLSFR